MQPSRNFEYVETAFDKFIDVQIGSWVQITPKRRSVLLRVKPEDESQPRTPSCSAQPSATLYYNLSAKGVTDQLPLEFGGSEWHMVFAEDGKTVLHFKNTFDGRVSMDPEIAAVPSLPPFAQALLDKLEAEQASLEALEAKERIRKQLAESRIARGLDPVLGNPPPKFFVLKPELK